MNFKLPRNIISNNVIKNVLYLVSSALAVSYIINEQSLALLSLIAIACGVYVMNKSVVIALFVAIIITNLLLSMNYLKESNIIEGLESKQRLTRQSNQEEQQEQQEPQEPQEPQEQQEPQEPQEEIEQN